MLQHLLYYASPDHAPAIVAAMKRLRGKPVIPSNSATPSTSFEISHPLLGDLVLQIHLITETDALVPFLRHHVVDLLIYDERGVEAPSALRAIQQLRGDVTSLAELWGPDFMFPLRRVVAILRPDDPDVIHTKTFDLGRLQVRDAIVAPPTTILVLKWIKGILETGVRRENRVGMCLSGGGIEGFLFQIGTIYALTRALKKRSFYSLDLVAGISSGAIAGAIVAADGPIEEIIRSLHQSSKVLPPLTSSTLFDVAVSGIVTRIAKSSFGFDMQRLNPTQWLTNTLKSIPTGFFKGERLEEYFRECFAAFDKKDRFDSFSTKLLVGATDQDSFEHVTFGQAPWDRVAVSEALRASCALPPVFSPKHLAGRMFIDGQVTRSCNFTAAIDHGCRLLFVIDPFRPLTNTTAGLTDAQGGFYSVVQTVKALCSTRFEMEIKHSSELYPDVDFVVFQPDDICAQLMAGSPMKYTIRTQLIELAFKGTLKRLRDRHPVYTEKLGRYGFELASVKHLKELESSYHEVLNPTA